MALAPHGARGQWLGDGRFQLLDLLGEGANGLVHRARDRANGLTVALKTLRQVDAEHLYYLKREFRTLADLIHEHLVQLYELFATGETCFFTMELLHGCDAIAHVRRQADRRGPVDATGVARCRAVFGQLATGLHALHTAGHVHRDIKPSNVMVTRAGRTVLLDFGLAAPLRRQGGHGTPEVAGTFAYMAPEQAWGSPPSVAADWYAVGAMLFEALTGQAPFVGPPPEVVMRKQIEAPPHPRARGVDVPSALGDLVVALLDPTPSGRPGFAEVASVLAGDGRTHGVAAPSRGGAPVNQPFVGRSLEAERLRTALDRTRAGGPVVIHVHGPSGIGKTELVKRCLDEIGPADVVLSGRCHMQESVAFRALDPLMDQLSDYLLGAHDDDPARLPRDQAAALLRLFPVMRRVRTLRDLAATAPEALGDPQEIAARGFRALRRLLTQLASQRPLYLWVDDAQWGDGDSGRLLRLLLAPPAPPPIGVVLSYHAAERGIGPLVTEIAGLDVPSATLEIGPLATGDARRLAEALLPGHDVGSDILDQIASEAGGSPFFVGELIRHLQAHEASGEPLATLRLSVAEATRARVERLAPDARALLELVAVAGEPLELDLALELSGVGRGGEPLVHGLGARSLLRLAATRDSPTLEPYHNRIRDTLLHLLPPEGRRARHLRIAEHLRARRPQDAQRLVVHYLEAGDTEAAREWALPAARAARTALAFDRAVEFYDTALRLDGTGDEATRIERAECLAASGRNEEAGRAFEEAARRLDQPLSRAGVRLRSRAAEQHFYGGNLVAGTAILRDVLHELRIPVPRGPRDALLVGTLLRLRFVLRGSRLTVRDAGTIAPDVLLRLDALIGGARGTVMLDHPLAGVLAARHLLAALAAGEPSHALRALAMEAAAEANIGGPWLRRRSLRLLDEAEALAARTGLPEDRGAVLVNREAAAWFMADWERCVAHGEEALRVYRTECTGAVWETAVVRSFLLGALCQLGRVAQLRALLPALLDDARSRGDRYSLGLYQTSEMVLVPLAADDPIGAIAAADATLESVPGDHFTSQHFHHLVATTQADLYVGQGEHAWGRLQRAWSRLAAAGFLYLDCIGTRLRYLRAAAALAAARTDAASRDTLSRLAQREARRIDRSTLPIGRPFAAAIRAGLAARRGDESTAVEQLEAAEVGFDRARMSLHGAAARHHLAAVGAREHTDAWMRGEGIANPTAMARAVVPPLR